MTQSEIVQILERLEIEYPHAKTELEFNTPFQLLIATILSAQSTDVQVNKITKGLFAKYPGPSDFAEADHKVLEKDIKGVGLFRNKSKNIVETSRIIRDKHGGSVPDTMEELIQLPGVGRKTANVVLANAFNIPAIAVDTHVFRVSNRLGIVNSKNPEATELDLQKNIPMDKWSQAHHWLIFHGRRVCHARKPACTSCVVEDLCKYREMQKLETVKEGT